MGHMDTWIHTSYIYIYLFIEREIDVSVYIYIFFFVYYVFIDGFGRQNMGLWTMPRAAM